MSNFWEAHKGKILNMEMMALTAAINGKLAEGNISKRRQPFDINRVKQGVPIQTRNGYPAGIFSYEGKNPNFHLMVGVIVGSKIAQYTYSLQGLHIFNQGKEDSTDLFMVY